MRTLVLGTALTVAGLVLFFHWFENANLYFPDRDFYATPRSIGLAFEEVDFPAADGTRLHAWFIPADKPDAPVLLLCHGNGGNISSRVQKIRILHEIGASVFAFDYRGYGKSRGRPSEKGLYSDGEGAYRWLTETRKVPGSRLVAHGESLGGAVCLELAARHAFGGVILDSAFTSVVAMGKKVFPFLPVGLIVRQRYDNLEKLPKVRVPVLVLHSPQDDIIPYAMGQTLFEKANPPKEFAELKGDHNEGFLDSGPLYPAAISSFLQKHIRN